MKRKIISLFTLLTFIAFSISCYSWKKKEIRTEADWRGKKGKILSLVKTSGEYIKFSRDNLGRIHGDKIVGTAVVLSKKVEITQDNIKKVKEDNNGTITKITNEDGKIYRVVAGTMKEVGIQSDLTGKEEEKIIFFTTYKTFESVTIPLSEVKSVKVKNIDFVVSLIAVGAAIGLAILCYALSMKEFVERFEL